jgi:sugar phosphate isomerase/epimerase
MELIYLKLSYSTLACPEWNLDEILKKAKENNYQGVELRGHKRQHISTEFSPAERKNVKKMFADNNIEISCLTAYTRFNYQDKKIREENIEQLKKMIKLASEIGAPYVRTFGANKENQNELKDVISWIAEAFDQVDQTAEKHGVKVLLEIHDVLSKGKDVIEIFKQTDSKNCGVIWDVAHSIRAGESIEDTIYYLKDYIYHVHLKDWLSIPGRDEDHYVLLGAGEVEIKKILKALAEIDYKNHLSLEWEKTWHPEIEESEVAIYQYAYKMRKILAELSIKSGE